MIYKMGIFSDIHANNYALSAILKDAEVEQLDEIIHLGDSIALGPDPKTTLKNLKANNITMIMGNHEQYYLSKGAKLPDYIYPGEWEHQNWTYENIGDEYIEWIKRLPNKITKEINGFKFVMMHYSGANTDNDFKLRPLLQDLNSGNIDDYFLEEADVIFFGHDHRSMDITSSITHTRYIDPGSSGCSSDNLARYVIVEVSDNNYEIRFKAVPYEKSKLIDSFIDNAVPSGDFILKFFHGVDNKKAD
ncbi:MAG: metallophosphoesterase family protein [Clostridiales bacterium]|nr:metallophosphoesterase family protein [Clostridiales bacterium]